MQRIETVVTFVPVVEEDQMQRQLRKLGEREDDLRQRAAMGSRSRNTATIAGPQFTTFVDTLTHRRRVTQVGRDLSKLGPPAPPSSRSTQEQEHDHHDTHHQDHGRRPAKKAATSRRSIEEKKAQAAALHESIATQVEALRDSERWTAFLAFASAFHAYSSTTCC